MNSATLKTFAAQDLDLTESDFYPALREKLLYEKEIGLEYINFHIRLPPKYLNSGGEYRDDAAYHRLCAQRIERIQSLCFELGLNCYFETHMNMISEDPAGFVAIMEACPVYFVRATLFRHAFACTGICLRKVNKSYSGPASRCAGGEPGRVAL